MLALLGMSLILHIYNMVQTPAKLICIEYHLLMIIVTDSVSVSNVFGYKALYWKENREPLKDCYNMQLWSKQVIS